jgi:16S rRNA (cytosine1402-N4)-methyltransferase
MTRSRPPPPRREDRAGRDESEAIGRAGHVPVLVEAVIDVLSPRDDALYVDGTFGAGGYSGALLAAANCRVVAIDRDPDAVRRGRELARAHGGRLTIIEGNFGDMERLLASPGSMPPGSMTPESMKPAPIAGIALDLGVSSIQLDTAERGFSFRFDGPLDMRMSGDGQTAADLVATLDESSLARLIREFGEERFARRIARAIAAARRRQPIGRTLELAQIVRAEMPKAVPGLDPATRTFQALRIAVNDELGELDRALGAAERLLMPGGRLAIVSFHSLEDRRVKDFLRQRSDRAPRTSRHEPVPATVAAPSFQLLHRGALKPGIEEIDRNPRARAARLRAAERTAAPPWPPSRDRQQRHAA